MIPTSDRTIRVRLQADIASYVAGLKQAGTATAEFGRNISGMGAAKAVDIERLGTSSLVAGAAISAAFGVAINSALNFDRQLSELGAVSSATAEEMSTLRQAALDAGAATAFSASEAAQAQTELAKAGVSTSDILAGGLTGALSLAAAGGIELADAATYAANAMTTFGLAGSDVGRIADTLAAGANKSAADVKDIGQALEQSGLVADQFGLSMEDTVGVLAAFAQAGLRGSDAGTSFKTMLQRLVPQSAEAAAKMAELGIEMFDAAGNFVGIEAAAGELQEGLQNLSVEQRNTALATIFGSDAVRAATILYENGSDGIGEWIRQVDDAGFASEVAAQRMDNLAGDLEALRGAIETALIEGGSSATGALRFMAQGATDVVNAFSALPAPLQGAAVGVTGVSGAGLLLVGAIGTLIPKVQATREALNNMGAAGVRANTALGKLGKLGAAGTGLVAFGFGIRELSEAIEGLLQESAPNLDAMANALVRLGEDGQVSGELLGTFGEDLQKLADDLNVLEEGRRIDIFQDYDEAVDRIDAIDKALAQLVDTGNAAQANDIYDRLNMAALDAGAPLGKLRRELNDYESALARADTQGRLAAGATGELGGALEEAVDPAEELAAELEAAVTALEALFDLSASSEVLGANLRDDLRNAADEAANLAANGATAQERYDSFVQMVSGAVGDMDTFAQALLDQGIASQDAATLVNGLIDQIFDLGEEYGLTEAQADDLRTQLGLDYPTVTARVEQVGLAEANQAAADLMETWALLQQTIESAYGVVPAYVESGFVGPLVPGQQRLPGNARGGYAGTDTWGPTDRIPALLSDGEFVLQKSAADRLGPQNLYALNAGLPLEQFTQIRSAGFDDGGLRAEVATLSESISSMRPSFTVQQTFSDRDIAGQAARGVRRVYMSSFD